MRIELIKKLESGRERCSLRLNGTALETGVEKPGKKSRVKSKIYPSEEKALTAYQKALAKLVVDDFVATSLEGRWDSLAETQIEELPTRDADQFVLVFDGDCSAPHDLLLDYRRGLCLPDGERILAGIYVKGDLRVEGCLINWEDDYGPFLVVEGNLRARSMATGGAELIIKGDLLVEGELLGVYNHGYIRVAGDLRARAIATEHTIDVAGETHAMRYDGWHEKVYRYAGEQADKDDPYDLSGVFQKSLIRDQALDMQKARQALAKGKPITQESFISIAEHFRKLLGKKLEVPEKVKSLSLKGKDLTLLPDLLFEFPNLEKLNLEHNELRTLPPEIGRLKKLKELYLHGNGLTHLPEEIGELSELRILDLQANCVVELPGSLARCQKLESISLVNNPYSYVLKVFGSWSKVELMREFPEVLTKLPNLKQLKIEQIHLSSLPREPFASELLEPFTIKNALIAEEPNPELYPQMIVDIESNQKRAVNYIRYWFSREDIVREAYYNKVNARYDWSDIPPLLDLLIDFNTPLTEPYDEALAQFEKCCEGIVKWFSLGDAPDRLEPARSLFSTLLEHLAKNHDATPLTSGLKELFGRFQEG